MRRERQIIDTLKRLSQEIEDGLSGYPYTAVEVLEAFNGELDAMEKQLAKEHAEQNAKSNGGTVVYTSERGGQYTEGEIRESVLQWTQRQEAYSGLAEEQFLELNDIVYHAILGMLTWQSPTTLIHELDEDDVQGFLDQLQEQKEPPKPLSFYA